MQGWADEMVPPAGTIEYYEQVKKTLGAQSAQSVRLFMAPGMAHCRNPPGADAPVFDVTDYDPLAALEGWVEKGVAPASIPAVKRNASGATLYSRPLCPHPARAQYSGSGDRSDARNWSCRE